MFGNLTRNVSEFSCYHHDLADHLGIVVVPQTLRWLIVLRIQIDYQVAIFGATAPTHVGSIAFQKHIQRLLPDWLRSGVDGLLFVPIYDH